MRPWLLIFALFFAPIASHATDDALLWHGAPDTPTMDFRAWMEMFPLYGGIPLYADMYKGFEGADRSVDNSFHDKAAWTKRFEEAKRLRQNALVLTHPHPFPLFLDYGATYPEARYLEPDELVAKRDMLRWIIAEGERCGIRLYFLIWNIWLPRDYAKAHGIEQSGVDTPETRAFMAWSVRTFFETYPGFGGLIPIAGETPPRCVDFARVGIAEAMNTLEPKPDLIFWSWCSYPDDIKQVINAYKGPSQVLEYLQYEQFFAEKADPRIGMLSRDMEDCPMVALGGPKSSLMRLPFSSPAFIHRVLRDYHANNNGRGMIAECVDWPEDRWLARLAFARYSWDPTGEYDRQSWLEVIADHYGAPALAEPLLLLFDSISRVIPIQLGLTHSQSDHFMIQPGISLAQALYMPTISTYIFENEQRIRPDGLLASNLGLSRPNPDWGVHVQPIMETVLVEQGDAAAVTAWRQGQEALGFQTRDWTHDTRTAGDTALDLRGIAKESRERIAEARALSPQATANAVELERTLRLCEATASLAVYLAAKDEAALAWERHRVSGGPDQAALCVTRLEESLEAWKAYAKGYDEVYNQQKIDYWLGMCTAPPPWTQNDMWFSYSLKRIMLSDRTPLWERELELIRQRLASPGADRASLVPPLFDELIPPETGVEVARFDFEKQDDRYRLLLDTCRVAPVPASPELLPGEGMCLVADSTASESEWHNWLVTLPEKLPLKPNTRYQVTLRYKILSAALPQSLTIGMRSDKGGVESDVGDLRLWGKTPGVATERVFQAVTKDFADYHLFLGFKGKASVAVDDILVTELEMK